MRFVFSSTLFLLIYCTLVRPIPALGQENGLASLEGLVVDAVTQRPVAGAVIFLEAIPGEQILQKQRIGPTGTFKLYLDPKKAHYIRTEAVGYQPTKEKFTITSGYATDIHNKFILLTKGGPVVTPAVPVTAQAGTAIPASLPPTAMTQPAAASPILPPVIAVTKPVPPARPVTIGAVQNQLKAVQFVQSKAELRPDAQPALDQLLTFLRENPAIRIELAGHTDNQGDFDENLKLSKQRVEVVKAYLVRNGITENRIVSRGYGSTRPIAPNTSEATRRLNRRVELIMLTK